jgi:hypothetical protein
VPTSPVQRSDPFWQLGFDAKLLAATAKLVASSLSVSNLTRFIKDHQGKSISGHLRKTYRPPGQSHHKGNAQSANMLNFWANPPRLPNMGYQSTILNFEEKGDIVAVQPHKDRIIHGGSAKLGEPSCQSHCLAETQVLPMISSDSSAYCCGMLCFF